MKISINDLQEDMLIGLKMLGCSRICIMTIAAQLQNPDDMKEMLMYMVDNQTATQEELYKVSSRISAKRGDPPEIDEEEDEYAD